MKRKRAGFVVLSLFVGVFAQLFPVFSSFGDTLQINVARILEGPNPYRIHSFELAPNGDWVVAGTEEEVWVWEAATGLLLDVYRGENERVLDVFFSPDSERVFYQYYDTSVRPRQDMLRAVSLISGEPLFQIPDRGYDIEFSPDGNEFLSTSRYYSEDAETYIHNLRVFNSVNGEVLISLDFEDRDSGRIRAVFTPDQSKVVAALNRRLFILDRSSGEILWEYQAQSKISAANVDPGQRRLIAYRGGAPFGQEGELILWDFENLINNQPIVRYAQMGGSALYIDFHPSGETFMVGVWRGSVVIRDVLTGESVLELTEENGTGLDTNCPSFIRGGEFIVESRFGKATLWRTQNGEKVGEFPRHGEQGCNAFGTSEGNYISTYFAGSRRNGGTTVRLFDIRGL